MSPRRAVTFATRFPLVQLPKKFKVCPNRRIDGEKVFPLVQLPKKFKAEFDQVHLVTQGRVSISSTSEEVQRDYDSKSGLTTYHCFH